MDGRGCGIDVRDHFIDRDITVGGEMDAVAAGRRKAIDAAAKRERCGIEAGSDLFCQGFFAWRPRKPRLDLAAPHAPLEADPYLAKKQVGNDPSKRQCYNHHRPSDP